jgi:hypothetical protein
MHGNPYEAELEVRERTAIVRHDVDQARATGPGSAGRHFDRPRLLKPGRLVRPVRAWWVPAAFVLGMLTAIFVLGV